MIETTPDTEDEREDYTPPPTDWNAVSADEEPEQYDEQYEGWRRQ